MPEAVAQHQEWAEHEEIEEPFPLPYCMMFVGYLIVLLVDRVIMHKFMHHSVGHHHHNESNQCVIEPASTAVCIHDEKISSTQAHLPHVHKHTAETFRAHGHSETHKHESEVAVEEMELPVIISHEPSPKVQNTSSDTKIVEKPNQGEVNHVDEPAKNMSKTSSVILVIALCTHSIFEGVALGIQEDFDFTGYLAISIALHNLVASISLGGTFSRSGFSFKKSLGLVIAFSLSTPIGMSIGLILSD